MHICIIDMQFYDNNISDFESIFAKIDKAITLTIMKYNDKNLIGKIKLLQPDGIIISGSKYRILHKNAVDIPKELLKLRIPLLGICYGFEWQAKVLQGSIDTYTDGFHKYERMIEICEPFRLPQKLYYFAHHDFITAPPKNWIVACKSRGQIWIAYEPYAKHLGIQFHPEKHIASGMAFFSSWLKWIMSK